MGFSLCRLSCGFSALFISMIAIGSDASAQVHQEAQSHDYQNASSMGISAANRCYQQKKIDECDNLHQIQSTLFTWCSQNDQDACELHKSLISYEMSVQSSQMLIEMSEQIE